MVNGISIKGQQAMNFGIVVRIATILIGIVAATLLVQQGFKENLPRIAGVIVDDAFSFLRPLELYIINPSIGWLGEQGFAISVAPHWKHAFVLLWVFYGSLARAFSSPQGPVNYAFVLGWGGFCAFLGGVLSGVVPVASEAFSGGPSISTALYAVPFALRTFFRPDADLIAGKNTFSLVLALTSLSFSFAFYLWTSLAALVVSVAACGACCLLVGFLARYGHEDAASRGPLDTGSGRAGLDILTVLGGAAVIVYVGHLLA